MTEYVNHDLFADQVRHPRAILKLGDQILDFERVTITHSGTYQAGTFSAVIRSAPGSEVAQWGWWLQQDIVILDLFAGFPADPQNYSASDLTPLFVARIDQIRLNAATNTLNLEGRDLSAILIDKKTDGQFQNKVSSDVATQFAASAGLDAKIQTTTTKIGTYYEHDYLHLQREQTQWALLTYLARKEGVQCFVLGRTLYFGQYKNSIQRNYLIQFYPQVDDQAFATCNAKTLEFEHDLTLSRDVIVTVRALNLKTGKGFTAIAKASSGKAQAARSLTPILPKSAADPQNYVYTIHRAMSPAAAQEKALQLANEISKHEMRMTAELPGDDVLYPWVLVEVQGTNTLFDATYYPSEVTRTITPTEFSMHLRAKNHQTETQVALQ